MSEQELEDFLAKLPHGVAEYVRWHEREHKKVLASIAKRHALNLAIDQHIEALIRSSRS